MIIAGRDLTAPQRAEVLRTFVHRWTHENAEQTYRGQCPACVQSTRPDGRIITGVAKPKAMEAPLKVWTREEWHAYHVPLTSDAAWLDRHAFHFTKDGRRLMKNRHFAESI